MVLTGVTLTAQCGSVSLTLEDQGAAGSPLLLQPGDVLWVWGHFWTLWLVPVSHLQQLNRSLLMQAVFSWDGERTKVRPWV